MAKNRRLIGKVHPAVIAVWSALLACAHLLPGIVLLGVGGTMSVSAVLLPLAGVLFGPWAGGLCAAIGQFIGYLIAPSGAWIGMFTWIYDTVTAVVAGAMAFGKWYIALGINAVAIGLWFTQKIGQTAWIYAAVFGGYGMLCMIVSIFIGKRFLLHKNVLLKAISIFICCVGGMVAMTMVSAFTNLLVFKTPAVTWKLLAFTAPVERTVFAAAAAIIGAPLMVGLPKIGVFVGPASSEEELVNDDVEDETEEIQ